MRKSTIAIVLAGTTLLLSACASIPKPGPVGNASVPEPAKSVDVQRYMGRWYEQYRYEASFQKDMDSVTALYTLKSDGTVRVENSGIRKGKPTEATGKAKIVDTTTNAKLKVSFFGPFYGDYWVLDHGDDYEWSIVGEPSGRYLWVLTREEKPSADFLSSLEVRVKNLGYNWNLIRKTNH